MTNQYVNSVAYAAVAQWSATTLLTVGAIRRQLATPAINSERCFRVSAITTGITGASEPTWILTKNGVTADAGVTWTECTGQQAYQTAGSWAAPFARLYTPLTEVGFAAVNGDFVFVASNHAETKSAAVSMGVAAQTSANPVNVVCIAAALPNVPPLASDVTTGASMTTTGNSSVSLTTLGLVFDGVTFNIGTTGGTLSIGTGIGKRAYVAVNNGAINFNSASGLSGIALNVSNSTTQTLELNNTTIQFASVSGRITLNGAFFIWRNSAGITGATVPPTLFVTGNAAGVIFCEGVDLSAVIANPLVAQGLGPVEGILQNCIVHDLRKLGGAGDAISQYPVYKVDAINCDVGAQTYSHARWSCGDLLVSETTVVRTGGASDGTTAIGWQISRDASNGSWAFYFESFPITLWNATVGAPVTLTIEGIVNGAVLPLNDEIWLAIEYLSSGSTTLSAEKSGTKASALAAGTALTASAAVWDSAAPARGNSTPYLAGAAVAVSSNPGRLFFCTTPGTSAASLPAGYASAVDGGSVSDGAAVFRAGVRFKQALTFTALAAGLVRGYVRVGKAATTYYVDPVLT